MTRQELNSYFDAIVGSFKRIDLFYPSFDLLNNEAGSDINDQVVLVLEVSESQINDIADNTSELMFLSISILKKMDQPSQRETIITTLREAAYQLLAKLRADFNSNSVSYYFDINGAEIDTLNYKSDSMVGIHIMIQHRNFIELDINDFDWE